MTIYMYELNYFYFLQIPSYFQNMNTPKTYRTVETKVEYRVIFTRTEASEWTIQKADSDLREGYWGRSARILTVHKLG